MKVLSKTTVYGLRALLFMVTKPGDHEYVSIREMSEKLEISFHFLTKILQSMTQASILVSYRGPNGGVAFNKPPEQIFLIDLVRIMEGEDYFEKCMLGLPGCGERTPCPMHMFWKGIRTTMRMEFEKISIADLGKNVQLLGLRLTP